MAFYEIEMTSDRLREVPQTTFAARGIRERADLQRLLRARIDIVADDAEGFAQDVRAVRAEFPAEANPWD